MKITGVEAIYVRQADVKIQCDSGQDALIVKVTTDAGITGIGEVDSNPMGAKGIVDSHGYLDIPQEPGLGIDLNEEAIARYV